MKVVIILCLSFFTASGFFWSILDQEISQNTPTENSTEQEFIAFNTMMDVISHKRCVNCHPSGDRPKQGEDSHVHYFNVQRGEDGHGLANLTCNTCHQEENNTYSNVPGAPHWHLAPISMAWEGLSRIEIAESMMNPKNNGGKNLEEIVKHLTEDDLVLWAFDPGKTVLGEEREKPPVSKEDFIAAVKTWAENGAKIPSK